jgi:phage gp29-like protein
MGQSQVGSFAIGSLKNSMTGMAANAMIRSIAQVLNRDLIRQTYTLNGWDVTRCGVLDFDGMEEAELESTSKAYQRYASTGLLELDREVLNSVRASLGIDELPSDMEPQLDILTGMTSRSGDGMATMGEGTSTTVSGQDTSSNNLENTG